MNPFHKRLMTTFVTSLTLVSLFLGMALPTPRWSSVSAQDDTGQAVDDTQSNDSSANDDQPTGGEPEQATDEPADQPPETPPDTVTEEPAATEPVAPPTQESTPESTEQATEAATDDEQPPTSTPTDAPTEPVYNQVEDDFEDGDTAGWSLDEGWSLVTEDGNTFLVGAAPDASAQIDGLSWAHLLFSARFRIDAGSVVNVALRAGEGEYVVSLDDAGKAALYRGETQVSEGSTPEAMPEADAPPAWRTLNIQALGDTIVVGVDGVVQLTWQDPDPLPAGGVIFRTGEANTGAVALDDVKLIELELPDAAPPVAEVTPEPTPEATLEATPEITPEAAEESGAGALVLSDDFEGDLALWTPDDGIGIVEENEANHALALAAGGSLAPADPLYLADLAIRAYFILNADDDSVGSLSIRFRDQEGQAYLLTIDDTQTALYRVEADATETLLASAEAETDAGVWHELELSAVGGSLSAAVDGAALEFADEAPLFGGQIGFSASGSGVLLDDISIFDLNPVEATPTPLPVGLSPEALAKLAGNLAIVLNTYLTGSEDAALDLAEAYYMQIDDELRIKVIVWAAAEADADSLSALVETTGGDVTSNDNDDRIHAYVSLAGLVALVNTPDIGMIDLPAVAVSTDDARAPSAAGTGLGNVIPHSLDILGVPDWAAADVTGAGVRVAVVDTGFAGAVDADDLACLNSANVFFDGLIVSGDGENARGTSNHGLNVVEVICDIAPDASVRMYRARTADEMVTALNRAVSDDNHVIVITMDLGAAVSPGDGSDGGAAGTSVYDVISSARGQGIVVIASAGNNGNNYEGLDSRGDVGDRYVSFTHTSGVVTVPLTVSEGNVINISWNDWDSSPNGGAPREDYTIALSGAVGLPAQRTGSGSSRVGLPSHQFVIPQGVCTTPCNINMTLTRTVGSASYIQVQTNGTLGTPTGGTISIDANAGSLGRPADSPDVIAVGAVCADQSKHYPLLQRSSVGPVFAAGGNAPTLPGFPMSRDEVKPNIMGPAHVRTSLTNPTSGCFFDNDTGDSTYPLASALNGFNETSAAAAHVAGIAALLLSNNANPSMRDLFSVSGTLNNSDRVDNLKNYLDTHTVDLFNLDCGAETCLTEHADGFDLRYGAGLAMLGNPNFNLGILDAVSDIGIHSDEIYVNPFNPDSDQTGAASQPFISPMLAIRTAMQSASIDRVVFAPGEYLSGLAIFLGTTTPDTLILQSYDAADEASDVGTPVSPMDANTPDSFFWVSEMYMGSGSGAIKVSVVDNVTIQGFVFDPASPQQLDVPTGFSIFALPEPPVIDRGDNARLMDNVFSDFKNPLFVRGINPAVGDLSANGVRLTRNVLTEFRSNFPTNDITALHLDNAGTATSPTIVEYNQISSNIAETAVLGVAGPTNTTFKIDESVVKVIGNRISGNVTQSLILVNNTYPNYQTAFASGSDVAQSEEVQFFSNIFLNNQFFGPLVYLRAGARFRFVNNSVALNALDEDAPAKDVQFGAIILRATTQVTEQEEQEWKWDIHNNLFYNNLRTEGDIIDANIPLVGSISSAPNNTAAFVNCQSIDGGPHGIRNNFLYRSGVTNTRPCSGQLGIVDPAPLPNGADGDELANGNYRSNDGSPNPDEEEIDSMLDRGFDGALNGIAANYTAGGDPALLLDILGFDRTFDIPSSGVPVVDIGAVEYDGSPPTIQAPDIDITINEDAPAVNFPLEATGGYQLYNFRVINDPENYSTLASNACRGEPVVYNIASNRTTYCPPADFYTVGAPPDSEVVFQYRATDVLTNQFAEGDVVIHINPKADPQPVPIPWVESRPSDVDFTFYLRPGVRFKNFRLSADPDGDPIPSDGVDYPFDYNFISGEGNVDTGALSTLFGLTEGELEALIDNAENTGGLIDLGLPTGTGSLTIQYEVKDSSLGGPYTKEHQVTLQIGVDTSKAGLYDDTSLQFSYDPNWLALYNEASINNTLHQTKTSNAMATFTFQGRAFNLLMLGDSKSGGNWTLEVQRADGSTATRTLESLLNAGRCSIPSTIQTRLVNGERRISSKTAGVYAVSCRGFSNGFENVVRIYNRPAVVVSGKTVTGFALGLVNIDAAEVSDITTDPPNSSTNEQMALRAGFHEVNELDTAPLFDTDCWTLIAATKTTTVNMQRSATPPVACNTGAGDDDVEIRFRGTGIAIGTILKPVSTSSTAPYASGNYDICIDPAGSAPEVCHNFSNTASKVTTNIFRPFFGLPQTSSADHVLTIKPNTGTLIVDSIVVMNDPIPAPLPVGTTENSAFHSIVYSQFVDNTWTTDFNSAGSSGGDKTTIRSGVPAIGPLFSFVIPDGTDSFQWHRASPSATKDSQSIRICIDRGRDSGKAPASRCITRNLRTQAGNGVLTITPADFGGSWSTNALSDHVIEIFSLNNEQFNLDRIFVTDTALPLEPGLYEEDAAFFTYTGGGSTVTGTSFSGKSARNVNADGTVFFKFNGSGFHALFTNSSTSGNVQICVAPGALADAAAVLFSGNRTCRTFNNFASKTAYKVQRTFAGLVDPDGNEMTPNTYSVAIEAQTGTMQFDAVRILNSAPGDLFPLTPSFNRYETNYTNRVADNQFLYYGTGWKSVSSATYSGGSADSVANNGAALVFRVEDADAITLYRATKSGYAPLAICFTRTDAAPPLVQNCNTPLINNAGFTGNQQGISVEFPALGDYIVSVIVNSASGTGGTFLPDAVEVFDMADITPLPVGTYENWHPGLGFDGVPSPGTWVVSAPKGASNVQAAESQTVGNYMIFHFTGQWYDVGTVFDANATNTDYLRICHAPEAGQDDPNDFGAATCNTFPATPVAAAGAQKLSLDTGAIGDYAMLVEHVAGVGTGVNKARVDYVQTYNNATSDTEPLVPGFYENDYQGLFPSAYSPGGTGTDWTLTSGSSFSGKSARSTSVLDATMNFFFEGTGFEIGTSVGSTGGNMEVCYDDDTTPADGTCITYANDVSATNNTTSRTIVGLPMAVYSVRVRNVDDPDADNVLTIDYVRIFGDDLPPSFAEGWYNDNATDGNGNRLLQVLPSDRWTTFSGTAAKGYSLSTFAGTSASGKSSGNFAGPVGVLNVEVPTGGSTLVIYTNSFGSSNGDLLVCSDYPVGAFNAASAPVTVNATLNDNTCAVVSNLKTTKQIVLTLPNGGSADERVITLRSLTKSTFRLDGFALFAGSNATAVLSPGIYDDFLAFTGGVLNLNGSWSEFKNAKAYGGTTRRTQTFDGTMIFNFDGTGFSIITAMDSKGMDFRVCVKQKSLGTAFPANDVLESIGNVADGDMVCQTFSTDTTNDPTPDSVVDSWNERNLGRYNPGSTAGQYGFAFYGFPQDEYTVEVRLVDTTRAPGSTGDWLQIDAVAIFGDFPGTALTQGMYDNTTLNVVYAPSVFWTLNSAFKSGPPKGAYNRTENTAVNAGSAAMFSINGNAVILYQTAGSKSSRDVRFCEVASGNALDCNNFSQNVSKTTYFTPIVIYGLGSESAPHEIILENRDHGRTLSVDGMRVLP